MSVKGPLGGRVEACCPACRVKGAALVQGLAKMKGHVRRRFRCRECGHRWSKRGPLALSHIEAEDRRLGEAIRNAEEALMVVREQSAKLVRMLRRDR